LEANRASSRSRTRRIRTLTSACSAKLPEQGLRLNELTASRCDNGETSFAPLRGGIHVMKPLLRSLPGARAVDPLLLQAGPEIATSAKAGESACAKTRRPSRRRAAATDFARPPAGIAAQTYSIQCAESLPTAQSAKSCGRLDWGRRG